MDKRFKDKKHRLSENDLENISGGIWGRGDGHVKLSRTEELKLFCLLALGLVNKGFEVGYDCLNSVAKSGYESVKSCFRKKDKGS